MKYFLDTEFVATGHLIVPVSVGIVSADGREFYREIGGSNWLSVCDNWFQNNVSIHLTGKAIPPEQFRAEVTRWIGDANAEFMAYYASYDWVVMCQLMNGMNNIPPNWQQWVEDYQCLNPNVRERGIVARNTPINPKPHHALHDAWELYHRWHILQGIRSKP